MIAIDMHRPDAVMICRVIGLLGFAIYVLGFILLCTGRLTSETPLFFLMNLTAACCVLISLAVDFNLSSALIQGSYVMMSLAAVTMRARMWRRRATTHTAPNLTAET